VSAGLVRARGCFGVVVDESVDSKVSAAAISLACLPHRDPCPALFMMVPS